MDPLTELRSARSTALKDLAKAAFHKRPPEHSLVPARDLPRALCFSAKPPFEPLDQRSMIDLSKKTAFLIAAISGGRVLSIEVLSVAENHRLSEETVFTFFHGLAILPRIRLPASHRNISSFPTSVKRADSRMMTPGALSEHYDSSCAD